MQPQSAKDGDPWFQQSGSLTRVHIAPNNLTGINKLFKLNSPIKMIESWKKI